MAENLAKTREKQTVRGRDRVKPIDLLHDDVLLLVFDFYVGISREIEAWQALVHVCRRWRRLVFGSPCRLDLRLVCTPNRHTRKTLDVWPALPLIVKGPISSTSVDNIVDALGHSDRVCQIQFRLVTGGFPWDKVLAAMQVPFPALTDFLLDSRWEDEMAPIIPDTFLGGSAPRLQSFSLYATPFPGLPKLLMSTTHLTCLGLFDVPHSGYITPEAMATCLSMLTSLDTFSLEFLSSPSRPGPDSENWRLSPMTRTSLPNLTGFWFQGTSEYLECLVERIDAPRLDTLSIMFLHFLHHTNFDTPHLVQFISRTSTFEEPNEIHVGYDLDLRFITVLRVQLMTRRLCVDINCLGSNQQLLSIAQICTKCLPPLLTVENLRLEISNEIEYSELDWNDDVNQWLEFLRPFSAAKNVYLSEEFLPNMILILQELVGDRTTEVLPSLQNIFLPRFELSSFQGAIGQFLTARQISGHPVAVLPLY